MTIDPSSITLKRINGSKIKPMKIRGSVDNRPVRGDELFPEVYSNVFLCAKKKSGKTIVIQEIVRKCSGPSTTVLSFCSTVNKDANHLAIRDWCRKHKIKYEGFPSIVEHKVDFLKAFIHSLEKEAEEQTLDDSEEEYEEKPQFDRRGGSKPKIIRGMFESEERDDSESDYEEEESASESEDEMFGTSIPSHIEKKLFSNRNKTSLVPREKFKSPEYILIFDDLSHELKLPSLVSLMKKNRHFKCKIIISSQYCHDLKPEQLKQLDYCLLFKGQQEEKLQKFITDCDIGVSLPTLNKIYKDATREPFSFLYCDVRYDSFRKGFSHMYLIKSGGGEEEEKSGIKEIREL